MNESPLPHIRLRQGGIVLEYSINSGNECVGTAHVVKEGLFYRIHCQCGLTGTIPCRITVTGEREADLGICVPLKDGFGVETRIPIKRVGEGELRFRVLAKRRDNAELFVIPSVDEPFTYLRRLGSAYLSVRNGQVGLIFKDQSPNQQDSGQNP